MKNVCLYFFIMTALFAAGCEDDKKEKEFIDKLSLIIGTWELVETNDPQGAPNELVYTFEENGTFTYRITVQAGSRTQSILEGTWRFADPDQKQLEITIAEPLLYTVDILNENTLQLTGEGVTTVLVKQ
jgi:hypothetical protein